MHRTLSLKIGELNSYLKCPLCKGYLIDSYTINECLHSFCKSCIIKYVKRKECCPVCKINIIKDRMNLFLKRDVNLQCIVYKIVPELFKKEMKRRRDFYSSHPKALKFLKKKKILDKEAIGELEDDIFMFDTFSDISLSIEYSETGLAEICDSARYKELDPPSPKIYLQCPASLSIDTLKKFLSIKFDVKIVKNIDVMYDDKPLSKELTLLDVSYIYAWRRTAPMRLFYRVNNEEEKQVQCNVLTSIENNPKIEEEQKIPCENLQKDIEEPKPTAKSTPQKDDASQSRLQIDLSVNNESLMKENLENSIKNSSIIPTQINTSQVMNSNGDNLTITAMMASITKSTNLETVSNSDKENEDETKLKVESTNVEVDKVKKVKVVKPKTDEVQDLSKKKKPVKDNPTKKQKMVQKIETEPEFNLPFSNKINSQTGSNYPPNSTTPQFLQNFQLMPLMYPWKNPYEYQAYQNFSNNPQQQQQQSFLNQKLLDYFQSKTQQQPQQQQSYSNFYPQQSQYQNYNHFNQYNNYIDEFKKPLANFASFIQEAASYQNNFVGKSIQNGTENVDSLKETQMKISESCSLVND